MSGVLAARGDATRRDDAVQPSAGLLQIAVKPTKARRIQFCPKLQSRAHSRGEKRREKRREGAEVKAGEVKREADSLVLPAPHNSNKVCLEFHYFWRCKSHLCQRGKCGRASRERKASERKTIRPRRAIRITRISEMSERA